VRVTTAFNRLLALEGISVLEVSFTGTASVMVDVALRRRRLVCPMCSFSTWARYDTRAVTSSWRHLDFGRWQVFLRARLRRLDVPRAWGAGRGRPVRPGRSRFTRDFEDLVAFLATKTDKTTIARLSRVDWDTVGRAANGWSRTAWTPTAWTGWSTSGWTRSAGGATTLVAEHTSKKIVWGAPGKDTATLDAFFDDLGPERAAQLQAVSMDMGGRRSTRACARPSTPRRR